MMTDEELKETCCTNCRLKLDLEKADYSKGGCTHSMYEGYCCLAFSDEGLAVHMYGTDPAYGRCECFTPKEKR